MAIVRKLDYKVGSLEIYSCHDEHEHWIDLQKVASTSSIAIRIETEDLPQLIVFLQQLEYFYSPTRRHSITRTL